MPITDNRTQLQDCEASGEISGDTDSAPTNTTNESGLLIQGSNAVSLQVTNAQEHILFDQDLGGSTFNLDLSDSTVYIGIKDNLSATFAGLGGQICLNDGADGAGGDDIGYNVAGSDANGLPYRRYYNFFKLDVSVVVATPGTVNVDFTAYNGTEANLNHAAILQVGYGSNHLAKAIGTVPNAWFDGIYYITNDSYAATIDGGTSGTPETMSDIAGDDETSGMGMISNPIGSSYYFFAPTEWGDTGTSDSYFTGDSEQWFWLGDNGGGHAVGATHFPFRFIGNGTGTNSVVLTNVSITNTGTGVEFDVSDTNMDTVEFSNCTFIGLASFDAPVANTSDFVQGCTFVDCGLITGNECDFSGTSFLTSTVAADAGAINWNETISTSHTISELDDTTFSMGTNNHHAISFPTTVSNGANITLRNIEFTGFDADGTGDSDNSIIELLATTGTITLTFEGCTVDGANASDANFTVDTRAGCSVVLVFAPVTTLVNVSDNDGNRINGVRVYLEASDGTGDLPYNQSITSITRSTTTATVTFAAAHGLVTGDYLNLAGITDKVLDNYGAHQVTFSSTTVVTYTTTDSGSTNYTGTITGTGALINGDTAGSDPDDGEISRSRSLGADQPVTGKIVKSSASPRFKASPISGTVSATTGLTFNVQLVLDE